MGNRINLVDYNKYLDHLKCGGWKIYDGIGRTYTYPNHTTKETVLVNTLFPYFMVLTHNERDGVPTFINKITKHRYQSTEHQDHLKPVIGLTTCICEVKPDFRLPFWKSMSYGISYVK